MPFDIDRVREQFPARSCRDGGELRGVQGSAVRQPDLCGRGSSPRRLVTARTA